MRLHSALWDVSKAMEPVIYVRGLTLNGKPLSVLAADLSFTEARKVTSSFMTDSSTASIFCNTLAWPSSKKALICAQRYH